MISTQYKDHSLTEKWWPKQLTVLIAFCRKFINYSLATVQYSKTKESPNQPKRTINSNLTNVLMAGRRVGKDRIIRSYACIIFNIYL